MTDRLDIDGEETTVNSEGLSGWRAKAGMRCGTRSPLLRAVWFLGADISLALCVAQIGCGGGSIGPRQLVAVAVQPFSGQAIAPGGMVLFKASGTFDQEPRTQANLRVQWISSNPNLASIDPAGGLATCLAVGGPVTVSASAVGKGGTVTGWATLDCRIPPNPVVRFDATNLGFNCSLRRRGILTACVCNSPRTVTLSNVGGATLGISSIATSRNSLFESNACGMSVESGQSCAITVTFHPSSVGIFRDAVTVTDNAADSPQDVSLVGNANCIP